MTTLIFIGILFFIILFGTCLCLIYNVVELKKNTPQPKVIDTPDSLSYITNLGWKVWLLIGISIGLIFLSFFAPFLFTRTSVNEDFNFSKTGEIGDTIGGLMNPFIAIAGVVITGLAFYIQYRANLLQRALFAQEQAANKQQLQEQIDSQNKQVRLQQFESQFYEMLKLHRDNVSEMKIGGYNFEEYRVLRRYEKDTEGRKVFVTMKTELECILAVFTRDRKLNDELFQKCYSLFFSGLDRFERQFPEEKVIIDLLRKARKQHEEPANDIKTNKERKEFLPYVRLYFNYKPFAGHASILGHYFRHLYLTVKLVASSDIITEYSDRMRYLRILRAQLSNHEQIFLFYNWLSGFGHPWEDDKQAFFTEYCMIHNLWHDTLFESAYIQEKVNQLRIKPVSLREGPMFEIDE